MGFEFGSERVVEEIARLRGEGRIFVQTGEGDCVLCLYSGLERGEKWRDAW